MSDNNVVKDDGRGILSGTWVSRDQDIDRDQWLRDCFPEWGTFLNQEIENFEVPVGQVALWWCGGTSWILKTDAGGIFWIDQYCGPSIYTERVGNCGVCRQGGAVSINWLRLNVQVIDPWKFNRVDGVFCTHMHQDHTDLYAVKAALKTTDAPFYAAPKAAEKLRVFKVPEERIHVARVGESVRVPGAEVDFLVCYDDTAIRTTAGDELLPYEEAAVSLLFKTSGGNILFLADTWYNDGYVEVAAKYDIDVALFNMGFNPPGATDKMTPYDAARLGQTLKAKLLIPYHYDNWANCTGDPAMLTRQLEYIVSDLTPETKTVIMACGGRFLYPQDQDIKRYRYPDGSEDFKYERSEHYKRRKKYEDSLKQEK
ncbi:MAG TPA: ascorbate 6-phosphate lactonase [Clostridiaceae bacterium]|nr:ascorbate 6-phosphate lactonase [Clostridiaceae bacterium]